MPGSRPSPRPAPARPAPRPAWTRATPGLACDDARPRGGVVPLDGDVPDALEQPGEQRAGRQVTTGDSPSPASLRASVTTSMSCRAPPSSAASPCSGTGNGISDASNSSRSPGRNPQISSVTNGITGCASATVRSSTHSSFADAAARLAPAGQAHLDRLDVPVAEVVPDERVERLHRRREVVRPRAAAARRRRPRQPRQDPAVLYCFRLRGDGTASASACEQHEPGGIPQLVGELRPLLDHPLREAHVLGRAHLQQAVARAVGAVRSIRSSGFTPVPSDFDMRRPSSAWMIDVMTTSVNGHLAHELDPHHQHPRHPQVDDVARRDQHVAGVELSSRAVCSGQPSVANGHSAGREPGVQHVGVALELRRPARAAHRRLCTATVRVRPGNTRPGSGGPTTAGARCTRGGCSPSSRRTCPWVFGRTAPMPMRTASIRRRRQLIHLHEPLQRDQRLDAVAERSQWPTSCS